MRPELFIPLAELTSLILLLIAALGAAMVLPPIAQYPTYHAFADRRAFPGIPYFLDVTTNLAFLAVGVAGIRLCVRGPGDKLFHFRLRKRSGWIN